MAVESWGTLIEDEDQLNDLSKTELIDCVKILLNYAEHTDEVIDRQNKLIEELQICSKDFSDLFYKAKPYLKSYYNGISLPFGFYIARVKKKKK